MNNEERKPRIAVVHDHLGFCGGGEKTSLIIATELGADYITAYSHADTFPEYQKKLGNKLIILFDKSINTRVVRFFWLRSLFWKNRKIFRNYDILIASGQTATEVVSKYAVAKTTKIIYTHSTPRRVFDQFENSRLMYPWYLRLPYQIFAKFWKYLYLNAIHKYDYNIANSECVSRRVQEHTGGDANEVIWPPIVTEKFKWIGQENYFLSWARVDEAKRVELVVKAFQLMPDKKLVVASGGPRLARVKELAKNYANIEVI